MAEAFKEFVNKAVVGSDLGSDNQTITLFTNDTNKQAIVRGIDVALDSKITKDKAKFFVGNQPVMETFESASGSLLVDSGQSLTIKLNKAIANQTVTVLPLSHQGYDSNDNSSYTYTEYTYTLADANADFSPTGVTPGFVKGTAYNPTGFGSSSLGTSHHGQLWRADGGHYWGWFMDTNSVSRIVYSADGSSFSNVDTESYSGPAIDFHNKRIYRKSSSTLAYWDMTGTSTSSNSVTGNMHSTNTSYQTGNILPNAGGDTYYFHNYSGTGHLGYVKKVGQSGSTNAYFGTYNANLSSGPKIVAAYNSTEEKVYHFQFKTDNWTGSALGILIVVPINLINNLANDNQISGQDTGSSNPNLFTKIYHNANTDTVLGKNVHSYSSAWDFKHLGGPYISFPINSTQVRIAKCENNQVNVVEDVNINFAHSNRNAANSSFLVGRGPITETTYTAADVDITSQVRVTGVELS